jgi:hypothetical protein
MMKAWNHPLSKNCKLFIINSSPVEVQRLGYKDLQCVEQMQVHFSKMNNGSESRPCYFYLRTSLKKVSKRNWIFGSVEPNARTSSNDSDPIQEVWKIFCQGRLSPQNKIYLGNMINWGIVNYNLSQPDGVNFVERVEKLNRKVYVEYNEKQQQQKVWSNAAMLSKSWG